MIRDVLGPAPLLGLSAALTAVVAALSALRITPQIPLWLPYAVLAVMVLAASVYVAAAWVRTWRRVRGINAASYRLMPRRRGSGDALRQLDALIGLDTVKTEIRTLVARMRVEAERRDAGLPVSSTMMHMVFTGPPGTGKTVVARLYAELLAELGVLENGTLLETDRAGLVGGFVGQTALKTKARVREALGGVLFVDEAYALSPPAGARDVYGQEAIDALMKEMEDRRDELVVIAAGYAAPMREFLRANPGLPSRFARIVEFPPYTAPQLLRIFCDMAAAESLTVEAQGEPALLQYFEEERVRPDFANARTARTLLERVREAQALRLGDAPFTTSADPAARSAALTTLQRDDIEAAICRAGVDAAARRSP